MSAVNQKAVEFIGRWKNKGHENQDCQKFWIDLIQNVFGYKDVVSDNFLIFQQPVKINNQKYIDVWIPKTKVIIEQKGLGTPLDKKIMQSDKKELTPFEQAQRYNNSVPYSMKSKWIVTCNFQTFLIYDMEKDPNGVTPLKIELDELDTRYNELRFLINYQESSIIQEQDLTSKKAGDVIGKLYNLLRPQYVHPDSENTLKSLNKLCVRLVFCLYAEDAGLFDPNDNHMFGNYLKKFAAKDLRKRLIDLFKVLNQRPEERDPYLDRDDPELSKFPYVNGNLFKYEAGDLDEIPSFTEDIKNLLISECSEGLDWSKISPTIFGALFESTLNPETRRSGGMHYTSIENIHKVIDPLFLDEFREEFDKIKAEYNRLKSRNVKPEKKEKRKLEDKCDKLQSKLASLKFLDPACGSGNFLTETYISLRRLENELIRFKYYGETLLGLEFHNPVKISIDHFYGIEINDFAVAVANTALWIAESQMLHETESIIKRDIEFLPLKAGSSIVCENALRIDWNDIVPKTELSYIIGNPPFVGAKYQSARQKEDVLGVCKQYKAIDYVACWYKKSSDMIKDTGIKCAFVSTNSITQGEQVPVFQKELFINILFARRTFIWASETRFAAHVHCVIIGFAAKSAKAENKFIVHEDGQTQTNVKNINGYLFDGPDIIIQKRAKPICDFALRISKGSQPTDGGNLLLSKTEREFFINKYPAIAPFVKRYMGARDIIQNTERYCFWLKDCPASLIRRIPELLDRIAKVRAHRLASIKAVTRKDAERPAVFTEDRQPDSDYIILPVVSSQNRRYLPIMYVSKDVIANANAQMIPNGDLYTFGVLNSSVHNSWMRAVCGRMKSDYAYSASIVYNNFVWVVPADKQRARIAITAQNILNARKQEPNNSLADFYDELTMPDALRKAHKENDKAVLALYGLRANATEEEIVEKLFKMYSEKVKELENT